MKNRFITLFFIFVTLYCISDLALANDLTVKGSFSTVIDEMNIDMGVEEDHAYNFHITETVTFNTPSHGIYRAIAQQGYFYREIDGQAVRTPYYAQIHNVSVESGQPFETSTDGDAYIIKIGDPNRYVNGKVTYSYSYVWDPGDDGIDNFDDVYNVFISQYLENPIANLNITIDMPKDFDSNDVHFYSGEYSSTTANFIDYQINGNKITAENTKPIYPGEVVSVNIRLPNGYFVGARTGTELYIPYLITAAIVLIICIAIYLILGRNKKPLEPVEFYPPNDFDSAQVGFITKGEATNEEIVSLIFYFANNGWLNIENRSPNNKSPKLYLQKIEDIPSDRPDFERTFFNALFRRTDNPSIKSLSNSHATSDSVLHCEGALRAYFTGDKKLFKGSAYLSKVLIIIGILVVSLFFSLNISYLLYRAVVYEIVLVVFVASFIGPFVLAVTNIQKVSYIGYLLTFVGAIGTFIVTFANIFVILGNFVTVLILGILGYNSNRRTEIGNTWLGECLGFRHFIKTAELNQLNTLIEENPDYYYNILPYAYALGLTDQWAKHFEGIALSPPSWYYDPYNPFDFYITMRLLNTTMTRHMGQLDTRNYRSMGSGGFGGGGFGGGGFAGGGGGGIGGGSW